MKFGYLTVLKLKRIEEQCNSIGLKMASPRYGGGAEVIALIPLDDAALPVYSRDSELFVGDLDQIETWLRGVEWARNYHRLIGVTSDKVIQRKEQDLRNKNLIKLLKQETNKNHD